MAFPSGASVTKGAPSGNATSTSIAQPAGATTGQLAIVLLALDDDDTINSTATSGWTLTRFASTDDRLLVIRGWIGAASWPLVVSHDSESAAWMTVLIDDADTMPVLSTGAEGDNTSPDPPNLTHGLGERDVLWLAAFASDHGSPLVGSAPSSFSGLDRQASLASAQASSTQVGYAWRQHAATALNPGTFAGAPNEPWVAVTLAIPGPIDHTPTTQIAIGDTTLDVGKIRIGDQPADRIYAGDTLIHA